MLSADRTQLTADGEDVAAITVRVVDKNGVEVPTADNKINFEIHGPARLLGVGNGDPSSHESEKSPHRRLFNGLAMALVQSDRLGGEIQVVATSPGLTEAAIVLRSVRGPLRPSV